MSTRPSEVYGTAAPTLATRWLRGLFAAISGLFLFVFSPVLLSPVLRASARAPQRRTRLPWRVRACRTEPVAAGAVASGAAAVVPCPAPAEGASARAVAVASSEVAPGRADVVASTAPAATSSVAAAVASSAAPVIAPGAEDRVRVDTSPMIFPVLPTFSPRDYAALFAVLEAPGSKLLELSSARLVRADFFEALAASWRAAPGSVPRLGIVLSFADWAALRDGAARQLAALSSRGVATELFYEEQTYDDMLLLSWFSHGQIVHNTAAVIRTLRARWPMEPLPPVVLDTATSLVVQDGWGSPSQIVELADIALSCGATIKAITLAREALLYLGEVASAERFNALQVLGFALMADGKVIGATGVLDGAVEMAIAIGATDSAAETLQCLGLCELNRGAFAAAEARFSAAIDLLNPAKSEFQATLYHNLALSLLHQGKGTAELNAVTALASRTDKNSAGAKADRALLRAIRSGRGPAS